MRVVEDRDREKGGRDMVGKNAGKHKKLPGYKLAKERHDILGWLPYLLSPAALASSAAVHHFRLPGFFYPYIVCAAYVLYGMAVSDYFALGR